MKTVSLPLSGGMLLAFAAAGILSGPAAAQRTCTEVSRICADAADRVVNGVVVKRDCWRWEKTFSCVEEA